MKLSYPSNKICPYCSTGGYVWYLEGSEYVAKCTNCGHYFHEEDFPMCVLDSVPKPKTNGDRIRAMTDEELADWLGVYCNGQTVQEVGKPCISGMGSCKECWLDWLKQEVQ